VLPPEVERKGLDAFERIGEDVSETIERRPASLVVARAIRPKLVAKDRERRPQGVRPWARRSTRCSRCCLR